MIIYLTPHHTLPDLDIEEDRISLIFSFYWLGDKKKNEWKMKTLFDWGQDHLRSRVPPGNIKK
jgi:hypothetical protein